MEHLNLKIIISNKLIKGKGEFSIGLKSVSYFIRNGYDYNKGDELMLDKMVHNDEGDIIVVCSSDGNSSSKWCNMVMTVITVFDNGSISSEKGVTVI